jgi:hypothetical protein
VVETVLSFKWLSFKLTAKRQLESRNAKRETVNPVTSFKSQVSGWKPKGAGNRKGIAKVKTVSQVPSHRSHASGCKPKGAGNREPGNRLKTVKP